MPDYEHHFKNQFGSIVGIGLSVSQLFPGRIAASWRGHSPPTMAPTEEPDPDFGGEAAAELVDTLAVPGKGGFAAGGGASGGGAAALSVKEVLETPVRTKFSSCMVYERILPQALPDRSFLDFYDIKAGDNAIARQSGWLCNVA